MPVYLCRWPNGDVSLAAGESEVEVADVLDEVDNLDAAELMQLDHAIAVHFKLGTRPDEEGTLPLRFEDMSEQLESSIYERAYPVYKRGPHEAGPDGQGADRSPETRAGRAAATAGIPGEMSTEDIRKMVCNPVYCLDRVAPWIAEPPGPVVPVEHWVAAGAKLIEEIGAEAYLRLLIQNLRGE